MNKTSIRLIAKHECSPSNGNGLRGLLLTFLFISLFQLSSLSNTSSSSQIVWLTDYSVESSSFDASMPDGDSDQPGIIHTAHLHPILALIYDAFSILSNNHTATLKWLKPLQQAPPQYSE